MQVCGSAAARAGLLRLLCACAALHLAKGKVPPSAPTIVQALSPSGLRISVSDDDGVDVVLINVNINLPIDTRETGQVSGTVLESRNGYWTLQNNDVTLKPGDVVFYWVYAAKGNNGERVLGNQPVHELVDPSCEPSPTTVNGRPKCKGQLIFEDNFDTFNKSIWKHSIQFSDDPDIDFSTYVANRENSFVKDGSLHLKATVLETDELLTPTKLDGCTWKRGGASYCERHPVGWDILPPTRSAMLTTKGTFSFRYGRVDIRAKTAAGDWLLSRLILEPHANAYGRNPYESGRLEILRSRGNPNVLEPSGWKLGAILNDPQADIATCARILYIYKNCPLKYGKLYSDEMHVFSVSWTPFSVTVTVDGECEHVIRPPEGGYLNHGYYKDCNNSPWEKGTFLAPFDKEFYVQLSLLVGGFNIYRDDVTNNGHPKPWTDKTPKAMLNFWQKRDMWLPTWKSDMEVDYVKIWAL